MLLTQPTQLKCIKMLESNAQYFSRNRNSASLVSRNYFNSVAQLVEALRYKPEGRGFDSRWCHWNFSLT
jgi:hypothetical protein